MRITIATGLAAVLLATAAAAQERRELGPHEHGHATLDIAVEGKSVAMALSAPGADIVGFEHAAEGDADRAALDAGMAALEDPLALFKLPSDAGCSLDTAEVRQVFEAHEHEEAGHEEEHAEEHGEEATHSAFEAEYALTCDDPSAIESIDFAFFDRFPNAEEVEVNLVSERGQSSYEVARDRPRLALDGQV